MSKAPAWITINGRAWPTGGGRFVRQADGTLVHADDVAAAAPASASAPLPDPIPDPVKPEGETAPVKEA